MERKMSDETPAAGPSTTAMEFRIEGSRNEPPEGRSRSGSSTSSLVAEDQEEDYCENSPWVFIPEPMFTKIFLYLDPRDMLNAGQTCKRWNKLSRDDYIWRKYFQREFNVDTNIGLKPGAESWRTEFKRLTDNVPMVMTDVLTNHSHQVLHVSFSHNGKMFATCSKDGFVIVWNSAYPSTIRDSYDMRKLSWKYTQFSQFNQSDTLLLVSGVHFGSPHSTSGEISVFTVQNGFRLRCRVTNRPYDIFGTWFSDQHLLSGDLHWLAHLVSSSILWLNKANQEVDSEHTPIRNQLYKFYNRNASSIRAIMVANCPWLGDEKKDEEGAEGPSTSDASELKTSNEDEEDDRRIGNPLSHYQMNQDQAMDNMYRAGRGSYHIDLDFPYVPLENHDYASPIHYLDEYRREYEDSYYESSDDCLDDDDDQEDDDMSEADDLDNLCPKYLIFSTGSKTYTPHQIGFKRISSVNFPRRLDPGPSLKERIALRDRQRELENETPPMEANWANYEAVADRFDKVDKLIDLHGHIIGMGLSPDHRYLYVNSRPWPKNYVIRNPLEPPPIAQEIDIHVIDLMTLKKVGTMLRAHKAYTPNTECFFIFLDVCDNYVASSDDSQTIAASQVENVCVLEQSAEMKMEHPYAITTLVLMFIAQAVIGIANIAFYCLGMSYMDDNLREHQSPGYIGCALGARIWGQQFGLAIVLAVGATSLSWWLGWVIIGPIVFILGFLIALFPKRLLSTLVRQAADDIIETATNNSTQSLPGHKWLADIAFAPSLKRVFTNGILIFNVLALVFVHTGITNFNAHEQNYLQSRFFLPTSNVNGLNDEWTSRLITNLLRPPVVALAIVVAGLIIAKANPSPRKIAGWNIIVGVIAVGLFVAFIFLSCDNERIAGAYRGRLTKPFCASNCICSENVPFSPVCPQDSVFTYFSPCHAGCQNRTEINDVTVYTDCSCGIDTELVLADGGIATVGACGMGDCQKYWIIFQVLSVVVSALLASALIGKLIISIRTVLPQDKALALSVEMTLVGLVAYLPGTAAYQAIALHACQFWSTDQRRCFIHENPFFGTTLNILTAVLIAIGVLFEALVYYFVRDLPLYGNDPDDAISPIEMRLMTQQVRNSSRQTTSPETEAQPYSVLQDQPDGDPTAQSNSIMQASTIPAQDSPVIRSIQGTQEDYPRNHRSISPIAGPSSSTTYAQVIRQLPTRTESSDIDDQLDFRSASSLQPAGTDDDDTDSEDTRLHKSNGPLSMLRDYSGMNPATYGAASGTRQLDSLQSSVASSSGGFGNQPRTTTANRNGRPMSPETDF